jgi:iron complex outermembrane receptor protein
MTVGRGRTNAHTTAIYSQGQFHLTPQVDLVAGGRLSWDRSRVGGDSIYNPNQEQKDTAPVYVLGVNYKPESDKLLYVKWSTGFIPGGIFNTFPYNPVTSTSYEIGIKADWLDHTVRTNLSVFDAAYKGLQTFSISFTPALTLKVINAGEAKAKGFEFEGTWLPVQGVTLGTAIGYTDLTFVDHITVPQGVPKWTADFNANYESPAQDWAAGGRFTARVDASYTSSVALASGCIAGPKNFRGIIPCSVTPAILAATNAPSKWNINGRVGLADINVGHAMGSPTTWQVALWVRNLLDNDGLQSAVTQSRSGSYSANYDPARTFGVDVNVKF